MEKLWDWSFPLTSMIQIYSPLYKFAMGCHVSRWLYGCCNLGSTSVMCSFKMAYRKSRCGIREKDFPYNLANKGLHVASFQCTIKHFNDDRHHFVKIYQVQKIGLFDFVTKLNKISFFFEMHKIVRYFTTRFPFIQIGLLASISSITFFEINLNHNLI